MDIVQFIKNQQPLDPEIAKVLHEHLWELLDDAYGDTTTCAGTRITAEQIEEMEKSLKELGMKYL